MNIDYSELKKGFDEILKEANLGGTISQGVSDIGLGAHTIANTVMHPIQTMQKGIGMAGQYVQGQAQQGAQKVMNSAMDGLKPMLPLAMAGIGMMGMGGMGGGGSAPGAAPAAPSFEPIHPAGFKTAMLGSAIFAIQNRAINSAIDKFTTPKQEEKKETTYSSKDPKVEKALENPKVKEYIHKLVS